jgi:DNA-binding NarL/FixJ family response regulator
MRTVIIDGEHLALHEISYRLKKYDAEILGEFTSPVDGYDFVMQNKPDVVFMSVGMPLLNGIDLGIKIREQMPKISIVYISSYPEYALDAFRAHPVDYLLQPVDESRLLHTVEHIKNNTGINGSAAIRPRIQCFGQFKVMINNDEIKFATQKVRELLAFLLCHNHKPIYKDELVGTIFSSGDEKKDINNFRVTLDKRTTWFDQGSVIRYTMVSNDKDAGEPKSGPQSWNRANTYFWKFTWRNGLSNLIVRDGGVNGSIKANLGTPYKAPYAPNPHLVRLGSVRGRAGSDTNPGTIIWNLWVSQNPRPQLPGDK